MTGDGRPLPGRLRAALLRELARIELLLQQIADVEAERDVSIEADVDRRPSPIALLARLKAIGPQIGAVLYHEGLYRNFTNRRDVAAYAGLVPTPWRSGSIDRDWPPLAKNKLVGLSLDCYRPGMQNVKSLSVPIRWLSSHSINRPGFQSARLGTFASASATRDGFVESFIAEDVTVLKISLRRLQIDEPANGWQNAQLEFKEQQTSETAVAFLNRLADAISVDFAPEQKDPWYGNLYVDIGWSGLKLTYTPNSAPRPLVSAGVAMTSQIYQALTIERLQRIEDTELTEIFAVPPSPAASQSLGEKMFAG